MADRPARPFAENSEPHRRRLTIAGDRRACYPRAALTLQEPLRRVRGPHERDTDHPATRPADQAPDTTSPRLHCAACGHAITDRAAATAIQGGHEHHFVNPHGHDFHVGLFTRAPGCLVVGPPIDFYSWFPGLPWRLAACAACHVHLGWAWGAGPEFFGLILPRLRDAA